MKKFLTQFGCIIACAGGLAGTIEPARSQQTSYIGDIMTTAAPFCPRGWYRTDGQLLSESEAGALHSLIGTIYGGDITGRIFQLPDLRGRELIGSSSNWDMGSYSVGQHGGKETYLLNRWELPSHRHLASHSHGAGHSHIAKLTASTKPGSQGSPSSNSLPTRPPGANSYAASPNTTLTFDSNSVEVKGSPLGVAVSLEGGLTADAGLSGQFSTRSPHLGLTRCICVDPNVCQYPSRS